MALSIVLAFIGEGSTDNRFLPNIAGRLIEQLLLEKNTSATIQWQTIEKNGEGAAQIIYNAAKQAKYCTTLIVHCDADARNSKNAFTTRIKPGLDAIEESVEAICDNITVVIPITETEAWLLVDKELLKEEMNTTLSNHDLGLTYQLNKIESIADPKQKLKDAIHIHHQNLPRKRRRSAVTISELYEPISQQVELSKLEVLVAYNNFKQEIINALRYKHILD